MTDNDKRRLGVAALGALVVSCVVAAVLSGPAPEAVASVPPPGSPEVTGAFLGITRHVEQKPLPPDYTRTVTVTRETEPVPQVTRTVVRTYRESWWTRGPVRRVLSFPFRALRARSRR